jgi:predicted transcriptional regulator/transcriptional regulator with XRE-family HTH domain
MSRPLIGRTVRRLRQGQGLSQQALAVALGISPSYLNLIEHDQRAVTAGLLIKLAATLKVDIAGLSGQQEQHAASVLREVFADPLLGIEAMPTEELEALASAPAATQAVLSLYRAWRVAREDASGIALPSGRRLLLPHEEARDLFHLHANYFPALEAAAEAISADLGATPAERNHAIADRLRNTHGLTVRVAPLQDALRRYEKESKLLLLSEQLPRESRGFQMAFQLVLLEMRDVVERVVESAEPSSPEAAALIRIGLLNQAAACLQMPYDPFLEAVRALRHDMEAVAARFAVSFEQACQRLSSLQRPTARGVPFFFLKVDPAGNVSKRFSAAGFPFARYGGSCPRWVVHAAFATPGAMRVQVAALQDGATFLCFARTVSRPAAHWGEPAPVHVVAMGCDIGHAEALVYADGIDIPNASVGVGLSCRLCDRQNCRSRAFPPLEHRLALDPAVTSDSPYKFIPPKRTKVAPSNRGT